MVKGEQTPKLLTAEGVQKDMISEEVAINKKENLRQGGLGAKGEPKVI